MGHGPAWRSRVANLPVVIAMLVLTGCSNGSEEVSLTGEATSVDRKAEQAAGELAQEQIAECMRERGFVVGQDAQGRATSYEIPPGPDGDAQLLDALAECQEGVTLPSHVPASDEELSGLYDLQLERVACLRAQGYEPPPIPSRESYMAERKALAGGRGGAVWDPLDPRALSSQHHDPQELERACPAPRLADL